MTDPKSTTENIRGYSNMDTWCQENLVPFHYKQPNNLLYFDGCSWFVSSHVWVKIFFTENVDMRKEEVEAVDCHPAQASPCKKCPTCTPKPVTRKRKLEFTDAPTKARKLSEA